MKKNKVSMIIPLYNEEIRLSYCFNVIERFIKKNKKPFHEIIFVNDGSTDQSKKKSISFFFNPSQPASISL